MTGEPDRPLDGMTVVVTRPAEHAAYLIERLRDLGADPVMLPMIAIVEPVDGGHALVDALNVAAQYSRIVVTSVNGARAVVSAATRADIDPAVLPSVACVGPATAAAFDDSPFTVDTIASRHVAEGLVDAIGAPVEPGDRILLAQAEVSRDVLVDGLTAAGWAVDRVVAYRTVDASPDSSAVERAVQADIVTFTSSSTVDRFHRLLGGHPHKPVAAAIGPVTAETARRHGIDVAVEADPHTVDGLVDALVGWATIGVRGAKLDS